MDMFRFRLKQNAVNGPKIRSGNVLKQRQVGRDVTPDVVELSFNIELV